MQDTRSVAAASGYVLTDEGRRALLESQRCACRIVLQGFWAICPDCGTCYANMREELARGGTGQLAAAKAERR